MANEKVIITPEGTLTGTLSTDENLTTTLSIGPNVSRGLNQEEKLQLATAYEHSQAPHVQYSDIENLQELINVINEKIAILENSTVITVNSITVTYTGGNVEVGTSISSLTGITVKANYSDGTSKTVTGYTLSTGTISQGSNTITVTYQGKTATFNVTGISNVVTYTLTIDPTPSDSTVKINGVEQKSITVNSGSTVNWTVSKEGYIAQSGSTTVTKTETLSITLQEQTGGDETDTTATLGNAVLAKMVLGYGSED